MFGNKALPLPYNRRQSYIKILKRQNKFHPKFIFSPPFPLMDPLNLPPFQAKLQRRDQRVLILDILRRRYVALTPEEWVRQHFVHFLIQHKGYPATLMQNEIELRCGQKRLRCDTVVYDRSGAARAIIEYKAPAIPITQKVIEQIATYNILLHVDYLIVSNGMKHFCFSIDYERRAINPLSFIPDYAEMLGAASP